MSIPHRSKPLPTALRLWALLAGVTLALLTQAGAIDASDMDPHLPDKVILAAMRFHKFTRKAEDKGEWEQKHAELLGMVSAELEKASLSDNRAATALRTLIRDLKDAKFVTPKKVAKPLQGEYPVLPDGNRVLVKEEFHIDTPGERSMTFPFKVEGAPAMISVGIGGGSDDSGDKGLHYLLIDPLGRVIKRGFTATDEYVWEEHEGTRNGTWKLIIQDLDTDLNDKRSPGNRGVVEVLCKAG